MKSLERNVIAGLIVVFLALVANAVLSNQATNTLALNEQWVTHSYEVKSQQESTLLALMEAEKGVFGYAITGSEHYLETYRRAVAEVDPKLNRLSLLSADNPRQQQRIASLRERARRRLDLMVETIGRIQREGLASGQEAIKTLRAEQIMKEIGQIMAEMRNEEESLLKFRDAKSLESHRDARMTFAISTFTSLALVVLLGIVLMRGLTERKHNEAAIGEQREWLQITLSSIGDAVIATDASGRVRFLNPVAEALTGWTQGEAEDRAITEIFKIIDEKSRETVENPLTALLRDGPLTALLRDDQTVGLTNHTLLISRDGKETPIDDNGAPIKDQDGKLVGAVLVFRDMTTRQRTEEKLRASEEFNRGILESAPDCIITLDLDGRLLSINTPGASLMETDDINSFEGSYWLDFWRGADREAAIAAVETAKTGNSGRFQGFRPTMKETPKWWDVIVAPIRNPQGEVIKLLTTARDITALHEVATERQRIEQERARLLKVEQRARAQAEEANRIKDEFLVTVSHELRTPMNAILGWANLLRGGEIDEAGDRPRLRDNRTQRVGSIPADRRPARWFANHHRKAAPG